MRDPKFQQWLNRPVMNRKPDPDAATLPGGRDAGGSRFTRELNSEINGHVAS